jgi:hypothetical protein
VATGLVGLSALREKKGPEAYRSLFNFIAKLKKKAFWKGL